MEIEQKKSRIFSKLLVSCVIYTIISHYILSVSYESLNLSGIQTAVRSFTIYSIMFLVFSMVPLLIGLGIAKSTQSNRKKPIKQYFNGALIATWIIALIGLYGGWYGNKRVNEYYEKKPEVSSIILN